MAAQRQQAGGGESAERLMAGGSAWDAALQTSEKADSMMLHYASDEVSVSSSTITYGKGKWLITEHGSASD